MNKNSTDYRRACWYVLTEFRPKKQNFNSLFEHYSKNVENIAGFTDITLGVIRNKIFLTHLISIFSKSHIKKTSPKIINCLCIAIYELLFSKHPDYAIVNETVEFSNTLNPKKANKFVNAILRQVCRSIENKNAELKNYDAKRIFPISQTAGCLFNIDILPRPKENPIEYLVKTFSMPELLSKKFLAQFGYKKTLEICFASNRKPSVYARINTTKINRQELLTKLKAENLEATATENKNILKIANFGNPANLQSFKDGLFSIQDLTAASVAELCEPKKNNKIYDICAAPGTKTCHLAEITENCAEIIATDISKKRIKSLNENIERLELGNIKITDHGKLFENCPNDGTLVLVDVPCSNTGVLGKRPEVRYRLDEKNIVSLFDVQMKILENAAKLVKANGKLCYSTCSILDCENRKIINAFLKRYKNFKLIKEKLTLPSCSEFDHDGGYCVILQKG